VLVVRVLDASKSASTYDVNTRRSYVYSAGTSITQKLSGRASVVFGADFGYNHFTGSEPTYPDLRTQGRADTSFTASARA